MSASPLLCTVPEFVVKNAPAPRLLATLIGKTVMINIERSNGDAATAVGVLTAYFVSYRNSASPSKIEFVVGADAVQANPEDAVEIWSVS